MRASTLALLFAGAALAQPAVAEKLSSSYPTLTTATAARVAQAALAECQRQGFAVAVAVVDRGGSTLALLRDNLAGPHTPDTAVGKGWTAVSFRTDTSALVVLTEPGKPSAGIRELPNVVVLGGGVQVQAKGALLGAVGVSGAPTGSADEGCAKAGIKTIQDSLELE